MVKKARCCCCFFFGLVLVFLILISLPVGSAPTAADKDMSGMTNLGVNNSIISPLQVGFVADEQLISATNTLARPYSNDTSPAALTNLTNNNNFCETTNDAYVNESFAFESQPEAYSLWVTWDTRNLYGAVTMFAQGAGANAFILLDTSPALGSDDFTSLSSWQRELKFNGMFPDFFLGLYADYVGFSSAWYPSETDGILATGSKCGYQFRLIDAGGNLLSGSDEYKDQVGAFTNSVRPWAGYTGRGSTDSDFTDNTVFFKIPWSLLTNRVLSTYVGLTNWKIKICAATTGADSGDGTGKKIFDWIPDSRYSVEKAAKLGLASKQNNYFELQITDGIGNFRAPADLRNDATIKFYPGSYKDVVNDDRGQLPFWPVDRNGDRVKGLAPHLGSSVYFRLLLQYNTVNKCSFKVYDIRGNLVKTIFLDKTFEVPFGQQNVIFNDNPAVDATDLLSWDGRTENGKVAPMGIYFLLFKGEDGSVSFTRKLPFMVLK